MANVKPDSAYDIFDEVVFEHAVKYDLKHDGIHKKHGSVRKSTLYGGRKIFFEDGTKNHYYLTQKEGAVVGNSLWLSSEDDEKAKKYFNKYFEVEQNHLEIDLLKIRHTIDILKTMPFIDA